VTEESRVELKPEDLDKLPVSTSPDYCLNCGSLLTGPYCSCCGQRKRRARISLGDFLHDLIHEFLHVDSKFGRTMGLLLRKPGLLTVEFLAGRRTAYVSPLRLYLIWSAVFLTLALSFPKATGVIKISDSPGKPSVESGEPEQPSTPAETGANDTIGKGIRKLAGDPERAAQKFLNDTAKGMFLLMPFFGLLLFVFYRKREPFYVPHLYFAIHYHSFVFLAMSVTVLLRAPQIVILDRFTSVIGLWQIIYLYLSLRRVYGASRLGTAWRMIAVGLIYMLALGATFAAILFFRIIRG